LILKFENVYGSVLQKLHFWLSLDHNNMPMCLVKKHLYIQCCYWNIYCIVLLLCVIIHVIPVLKIFKWSHSELLEDNQGYVITVLKILSQSNV